MEKRKSMNKICKRMTALLLVICMCMPVSLCVCAAEKTTLNYTELTLGCKGATRQLKVIGKDVSSDGKKIKRPYGYKTDKKQDEYRKIYWTSWDEDVATVSANGKVRTKQAGTATIMAYYRDVYMEPIEMCEITVVHKGAQQKLKYKKPTKWEWGYADYKCKRCGEKTHEILEYKATEEMVAKEMQFLADYFNQENHLWIYGHTPYTWAWRLLKKKENNLVGVKPFTIYGGHNSGKCSDWADLNAAYLSGIYGYTKIVKDGKYIRDIDGHKAGEKFDYLHDFQAGDVMDSVVVNHAQVFQKYEPNTEVCIYDNMSARNDVEANVIYKPGDYRLSRISSNGTISTNNYNKLNQFSNKYLTKAPKQDVKEYYDAYIRELLQSGYIDEVKIMNEEDDEIASYDTSILDEPVERIRFNRKEVEKLAGKSMFYIGYSCYNDYEYCVVRFRELTDFYRFYYYDAQKPIYDTPYKTVYRLNILIDNAG